MAFLVMELDGVMINVQEKSQHPIHPSHLSVNAVFVHTEYEEVPNRNFLRSKDYTISIINPEQLSQLITVAFTEYSGLFIFTSEPWSRRILRGIAQQLSLPEDVEHYFINSYFFNRKDKLDCLDDLEFDERSFHSLLKCDWLSSIMHNCREIAQQFSHQHYVLLDNDPIQKNGLRSASKAETVIAELASDNDEFYQDALIQLEIQQNKDDAHEHRIQKKQYEARLALFFESNSIASAATPDNPSLTRTRTATPSGLSSAALSRRALPRQSVQPSSIFAVKPSVPASAAPAMPVQFGSRALKTPIVDTPRESYSAAIDAPGITRTRTAAPSELASALLSRLATPRPPLSSILAVKSSVPVSEAPAETAPVEPVPAASEAKAVDTQHKSYRIFRKPVEPKEPIPSKREEERLLREFAPKPKMWRY